MSKIRSKSEYWPCVSPEIGVELAMKVGKELTANNQWRIYLDQRTLANEDLLSELTQLLKIEEDK